MTHILCGKKKSKKITNLAAWSIFFCVSGMRPDWQKSGNKKLGIFSNKKQFDVVQKAKKNEAKTDTAKSFDVHCDTSHKCKSLMMLS